MSLNGKCFFVLRSPILLNFLQYRVILKTKRNTELSVGNYIK